MSARSVRRISVLASALLAGAFLFPSALAQQPAANPSANPRPATTGPAEMVRPTITLDPPFRDIGVADPNEVIHTTFSFINTGKKPLVLKETKAACSCTQASLTPTVIPPGGKATLNVAIDLRGSTGPVEKDVNVFFEGNPVPVQAHTKGRMSYAVAVEPHAARPNAGFAGRLDLTSIDGRPFKILGVNGEPAKIITRQPEGGERAVSYTIEYQFQQGKLPNLIVIETDHPDAPVVDVPVYHQETSERENEFIMVLNDIFIMRKGLNIGVVTPDKPAEYKIQVQLGASRKDHKVTIATESGDITAEIIDAKPYIPGPGFEYTVRVKSNGKREGYLLTPFYFQVDDKKTRIWGAGLLKNTWPPKDAAAAKTPAPAGSGQ